MSAAICFPIYKQDYYNGDLEVRLSSPNKVCEIAWEAFEAGGCHLVMPDAGACQRLGEALLECADLMRGGTYE